MIINNSLFMEPCLLFSSVSHLSALHNASYFHFTFCFSWNLKLTFWIWTHLSFYFAGQCALCSNKGRACERLRRILSNHNIPIHIRPTNTVYWIDTCRHIGLIRTSSFHRLHAQKRTIEATSIYKDTMNMLMLHLTAEGWWNYGHKLTRK